MLCPARSKTSPHTHLTSICRTIQASQSLAEDFEDLHYPAGFKVVSGLLLVPLSQSGRDFIVFFRRGQIKHIHWAGNPYDKYLSGDVEGRSSLEPRTSFKLWSETVLGKSKSWTDDQFETASVLALVYGKFIDVWRQKEVALRSHELTNLLLANASHEVRTPLNHIVGYLVRHSSSPICSHASAVLNYASAGNGTGRTSRQRHPRSFDQELLRFQVFDPCYQRSVGSNSRRRRSSALLARSFGLAHHC